MSAFVSSGLGLRPSPCADARLRAACPRRASRGVAQTVCMSSVLIVNAASGSHAFIGLHLTRALQKLGHDVTIFNDGDGSKSNKPPFSAYPSLGSVEVQWGDTAAEGALSSAFPGKTFDVMVENNAKTYDGILPTVNYAKQTGVSQFLYVSSAGLYQKADEVPILEGDAEKSSAGHVAVEGLLKSEGLNYASFRPIYLVGEDTAKPGHTDYFFDRIVRGRPVPLPESGDQFASLTAVTDAASMIAAAVDNPAASGQIFNMTSPRYVTFNGVVRAAARAAGKSADDVRIVHYDPSRAPEDSAKAFPFRNQHFIVSPGKAHRALGWEYQTGLDEMLAGAFESYVRLGKDKRELDFAKDDALLAAAALD